MWPRGIALLKIIRGTRARDYDHMADKEDADRGLSNQGFITASSMEVFHSAVTRAGLDRLLLVP